MDPSYGGGSSAAVAPPGDTPETETAKPGTVDEANQQQDTTVVPNKILSPHGEKLNEGDEIVVKVVKVGDNESVIQYAPHKEGEDEGEGSETGKDYMSEAREELGALDKGE